MTETGGTDEGGGTGETGGTDDDRIYTSLREIAFQVIENVHGDRASLQRIAETILSKDPEAIRTVLSEVAGVELSEDDISFISQDKALELAIAVT